MSLPPVNPPSQGAAAYGSSRMAQAALGLSIVAFIVPLGIALVVRMIPSDIMAEHRASASIAWDQPVSRTAAVVIVAVWMVSIAGIGWLAYRGL